MITLEGYQCAQPLGDLSGWKGCTKCWYPNTCRKSPPYIQWIDEKGNASGPPPTQAVAVWTPGQPLPAAGFYGLDCCVIPGLGAGETDRKWWLWTLAGAVGVGGAVWYLRRKHTAYF